MTDYELLEEQGQTNIFDYLDARLLAVGDKVVVQFEENELPYVQECLPFLLEPGEIIGKKIDFYSVRFGEVVEEFCGEKLVRV